MPRKFKFLPEYFSSIDFNDYFAIDKAVDAMHPDDMVNGKTNLFSIDHYRILLKCALKRNFEDWNSYLRKIEEPVLLHNAVLSLSKKELFLHEVNLRGTDLQKANLQCTDFQGADLYNGNFRGAVLLGAHLTGADLRNADLRDTDLREADLQGAILRNTNLQKANLQNANLRGADLQDADLQGADFKGADLRDAILRNAHYDINMLLLAKLDDKQKEMCLLHILNKNPERIMYNNEDETKYLREKVRDLYRKNEQWAKDFEQNKAESLEKNKNEIKEALESQAEILRKQWEEEQKTKEQQEKAADAFISPVESALRKSSGIKRWIGYICFFLGLLTLIIATIFIAKEIQYNRGEVFDWTAISYRSTRLIAIILMLVAISKYLYSLGRSYTRESIKESDRIHILSYGKFFLQAFGDPKKHDERKDIFADWNKISYDSFGDIKIQDIDPKIVELTRSLIQLAKTSNKEDKNDNKSIINP